MKVIADDKIPFLKGVLEPFADVLYLPGNVISNDHLRDADALITRTRTKCDETLLKGTKVKFIATATIGFDHIDTNWCKNNGIHWTNAPGCNSGSVYQYIASVLAILSQKNNFKFSDRSIGIVGVGNVGKKILRLAEVLGMRVLLNDPPRSRKEGSCGFVSLEGIIRECDIISCHVPLNMEGTDKSFHLFSENNISKLNKGTILINSSRGEVVDNKALFHALNKSGNLSTVLDVWENEPDIESGLLGKIQIATPHIAGYSVDGKANGTAMSVQAISRFFDLPLKTWVPEDIPLPGNPEITLSCSGKSAQEIMCEAILSTYNVLDDDAILRKSRETFEQQRGNYRFRREFKAYKIKLTDEHSNIHQNLKDLGFQII